MAQYLLIVDRFADLREPAEEAIAIAAQVGARAVEATAHATLGGALVHLGEADAGLAELAAAVRLATQTGDVIAVLRTLVTRSNGLNAAGRPAEAVVVALGRCLRGDLVDVRGAPARPDPFEGHRRYEVATACVVACLVPAVRATRVNPVDALRSE